MNKIKSLLAALLLAAGSVSAQTADPTIMTINGQAVPRSEFEYSYNKNNAETVVDKKSVADYFCCSKSFSTSGSVISR
mgnify:CR=1 FL=1